MNRSDLSRNAYMLEGPLERKGYDWWWHSFTGYHKETGEQKSFFIEFFIINPARGGKKAIFKPYPSYVMVKVGCWGEEAVQLHQFYPIDQMTYKAGSPFLLQVGDCQLSEKKTSGFVAVSEETCQAHPEYMSDAGSMEWNLKIDKEIAFNVGYGASKPFRKLNAFEMYWHAEGMKTKYSGTIIYNNQCYEVIPEKSYGYADKNWGSDFTSPWLWIGCSHIIRESTGEELNHSALDIGGGCPKVFGIPLKNKLLMNLVYEGKDLEYNFSKFWRNSQISYRVEENDSEVIWRVMAQDDKTFIKLKVSCKKAHMLFINYVAPNGKKLHNRLYNGGDGIGELLIYKRRGRKERLVDKLILKNVGCEYGEYDKK